MLRSTGGGSIVGVFWIDDRDAEQRAGSAGVLELAGEDVQALCERAGREGERRARDDRCGGGDAVEQRAGAVTGSLAVSTISLADVETVPSPGVEEMRVGAVLSNRTFVRSAGADGIVERVVADGAEVVETVGQGRRIEWRAERSVRVVRNLRPGGGAGGRDGEDDACSAAAGGRVQ
jgi:hypothetical protein